MFARAASCDVTPRDRPVRLAGYASRKDPVSTILDPIEISVVLLECAGQRCLIFSFDLMIVGSELQKLILGRLQRMGFQPDEVVLLASHTHGAPATDQACARLGIPEVEFVDEVAEAAENLVRQMQRQQPAEIGLEVFQGRLDHSINRRRYWPFPTFGRTYGFRLTSMSFAPNPSGPRDERATVALLRKADDGQLLGVLWHYTCHPTAVVPDNVISADYPGVVRRALRERFGEIPCVFAQGFCGDIRPNMPASRQARLARAASPLDPQHRIRPDVSDPLGGGLGALEPESGRQSVRHRPGQPGQAAVARGLANRIGQIPLGEFFEGAAPDKPLAVQIVQIGEELEIVALSAEACVEWERILDEAVPPPAGRIRLYAGYLGALFGYLPTAAQIPEGGYEVEGFQPLFGLSGHFEPGRIGPAIAGVVKGAFADMERTSERVTGPVPPSAPV